MYFLKQSFLKGTDYQTERTQNSLQYPLPSVTTQSSFKAASENKFYFWTFSFVCLKLLFPVSIEKYFPCISRRSFLYLNHNINDNTSHSSRISLKTCRAYSKPHSNLKRMSNCLECYFYSWSIRLLPEGFFLYIDYRKSKRTLPKMVIHYVIREIYFKLPHEIFKSFHLSYFCFCSKIGEGSGFLTRTISQSTFNSAATASIFSLQTEPRLVMPLSQYFFRVAKSRSLNWVRSCNCKIKENRILLD